jgi:hypothetical protein
MPNAAADVLFNIGDAAVDALIAGLRHKSPSIRRRSAILLGKIQDERAIPSLVRALSDWPVRGQAARALDTFHWKPQTPPDRIYYFIAKGQKDPLMSEWKPTETFLISRLLSGNKQLIEYGVNALIELGGDDIVPEMIDVLENNGTGLIAQAYYDSGHKQLMETAGNWADGHGYRLAIEDETLSK